MGFNHGCFNVEMLYDSSRDRISVIEVNPRMAQQFADLYEWVDGTNTHELQLALALGQTPEFRPGAGRHRAAGSMVLRRFQDARVTRVPTDAELAELSQRYPDVGVHVLCELGRKLSHEPQDQGSFRYGLIQLGGRDTDELVARQAEIEAQLHFEFS